MTEKFFSTKEVAEKIGVSRNTVANICRDNPGFSIRLGRSYKVPLANIERLLRGELIEKIAADVRSKELER